MGIVVSNALTSKTPQRRDQPVSTDLAASLRIGELLSSWSADIGNIRVTFGEGAIDLLGGIIDELRGRRALIVTDPGVRAAGHVEPALASVEQASLAAFVFDGVEENPTCRHVENGTLIAKEHDIDFIVGLGGGSAMDCAKGINFLYTNGGRMEDYWGINKATRPMLASVGIPTTAGTGSEAQRFALICQDETHRKMACGDDKAAFKATILDPALTATVPRSVAVATGMDAVAHAVESYVTSKRSPVSQMYARESWRLLSRGFEDSLADPDGGDSRGRMLIGAHLAGAAIECSMLGAAHACANPLTATFGITHGIAVGTMLPHGRAFQQR